MFSKIVNRDSFGLNVTAISLHGRFQERFIRLVSITPEEGKAFFRLARSPESRAALLVEEAKSGETLEVSEF